MVVYLFLTLFSCFFPSMHGWSSPRGISYNEHVIFIYFYHLKIYAYVNQIGRMVSNHRKDLTWYSLLNTAFSLRDMFAICAFIFLTGIFLFVGGPRFVFSGRAYVDSAPLLANDVCNLQSTITIILFWLCYFKNMEQKKNWIEKTR